MKSVFFIFECEVIKKEANIKKNVQKDAPLFLLSLKKFLSLPSQIELQQMVTFKLILLEEAQEFLSTLPQAASDKMYDNIHRIAGGERRLLRQKP